MAGIQLQINRQTKDINSNHNKGKKINHSKGTQKRHRLQLVVKNIKIVFITISIYS